MTKKTNTIKLLPVWIALSVAIIIAGIVLFCLMGFNHSVEVEQGKSVEITYGVVTYSSTEQQEKLQTICEESFAENGVKVISVSRDENAKEVGAENLQTSENGKIVFTFSASTSTESLESARAKIESRAQTELVPDIELSAFVHNFGTDNLSNFDSYWRGAIAIAVAAIVVFIYIGVRYGIGCALTGITMCASDTLIVLAFFLITRIPVYFYAPLIYAGLAALCSIVYWLVQCMIMKKKFALPEISSLPTAEGVDEATKKSWICLVGVAGTLAIMLVACGAIATAGSMGFFLPALLSVAVPLYSSLVFGPALHVPVKAAFDKLAKRSRGRTGGKKKSGKVVEPVD